MPTIVESLNAKLLRDPRWTPHPERRTGGTKYIATYRNRRGDAIALDIGSGGKNAIWAPARLVPATLTPTVDREFYPADRPRNSNLNVAELKDKPLMRLYPKSMNEGQELLEHFAGL